jgi:hypothetical protein
MILQLCSSAMHLHGIRLLQKFPGILNFCPEKSGRADFRPELFWVFKISTGKFLGFSNFTPPFFGFFNFRPEKFPVFQISRPKKVREFRSRCWVRIAGFTPEK